MEGEGNADPEGTQYDPEAGDKAERGARDPEGIFQVRALMPASDGGVDRRSGERHSKRDPREEKQRGEAVTDDRPHEVVRIARGDKRRFERDTNSAIEIRGC